MRGQKEKQTTKKKSRLNVTPGKSISAEDLKNAKDVTNISEATEDAQNNADCDCEGTPLSSLVPTDLPCPPAEPTEVNIEPSTSATDEGTISGWDKIADLLQQCKSYDDIKVVVEEHQRYLKSHPIESNFCNSVLSSKATVDKTALKHVPSEEIPSNYVPVITQADGNCLPRTVSRSAYGHEENHREIRARIVVDGIWHEESYLNELHLKRGSSAGNQKRRKKSVPLQTLYAQYSVQFIPGFKQLTAANITKLYRSELVSISQPGAYMGIWQLFQTANILQVPVHSIYPESTNLNLRCDFQRTMYPIASGPYLTEVFIMWTYINRVRGVLNHFVPLLPIACDMHTDREVFSEETRTDNVTSILYQHISECISVEPFLYTFLTK